VPGAWVFVSEHVPARNVGYACGTLTSGLTSGILLGSLVATWINSVYSPAEVSDYAWRIPFLLGAMIALVAFFLRGQLDVENDRVGYVAAPSQSGSGVVALLHMSRTVLGCACYMFGFYLIFVYLPNGLQVQSGLGIASALSLTSVMLLLLAALCPLAGMLADRMGPAVLLSLSSIALALLGPPILHGLNVTSSTLAMLTSMGLLTVSFAPIQAVAPLPLIEQALAHNRGTEFSLGYNIAAVGFGGLAPLVASSLVLSTGRFDSCGWLLAGLAVLSAVALLAGRGEKSTAATDCHPAGES